MKLRKIAGLLFMVFTLTACGGSDDDATTNTGLAAPSGVTAAIANNTIEITWTAVPDATKYAVYMASATGVTKLNWSDDAVWGMNHGDLTATFPHPAGLDPNTDYFFIVTALDDTGLESDESCEVKARISTGGEVCGQ